MNLVLELITGLEDLSKKGEMSVFDRTFQESHTCLVGYKEIFWNKIDDNTEVDFRNFKNNLQGNKVICISPKKTYLHYGDYSCSHYANNVLAGHLMESMIAEYNHQSSNFSTITFKELTDLYDDIKKISTDEPEVTQQMYCELIYKCLNYLSSSMGFAVYFIYNDLSTSYVLQPDTYRDKVFLLKGVTEMHTTLESIRMMNDMNKGYIGGDAYSATQLEKIHEIKEFGLSCNIKLENRLCPLFTLRIENGMIPVIDVLDINSIKNIEDIDNNIGYLTYVTCLDTMATLSKYAETCLSKEDITTAVLSCSEKYYPAPAMIALILNK